MTNVKNTTDRSKDQEDELIKMMERDGVSREQSFTQLGTTPAFIWYESEILLRDMSRWESRFKQLVQIMEERQRDHLKMLKDVMDENKKLKAQLKEKS